MLSHEMVGYSRAQDFQDEMAQNETPLHSKYQLKPWPYDQPVR